MYRIGHRDQVSVQNRSPEDNHKICEALKNIDMYRIGQKRWYVYRRGRQKYVHVAMKYVKISPRRHKYTKLAIKAKCTNEVIKRWYSWKIRQHGEVYRISH